MPETVANASALTADVVSGTGRFLDSLGYAVLTEFSLRNGRRLDIAGLDRQGIIAGVEVKVSATDFMADRKWPEYLDYCDLFYFAVPAGFPLALLDRSSSLPQRTGIIVADRYGGEMLREGAHVKISPARRKAQTLRFARRAAARLTIWQSSRVQSTGASSISG